MIRIKLNESSFKSEIGKITKSLKGIPSAQNVKTISRAVGSIAAKEFIKSLNREARVSPRQLHHLYEWGEVGKDSARLVKAKRVGSGENVSIELILKKSKKTVPIAKALLSPGKTGKSVTRNSVFRNKAEFMESGRTANWKASRNVVFMNNKSMIFKRKGTVFNISNVGGREVKGGLEKFARKWENSMAQSAIDKSKIFPRLEKDIAKTLSMNNPNSSEIRNCIKVVCDTYEIKGEI